MFLDDLFDILLVEVERRIDAKLFSQTELARLSGMQQGTLSNLLLRKKKLTRSAAGKLAAAANIEWEDLVSILSIPANDEAADIPVVKHSIAGTQPIISRRTTLAPSGITTRAIEHTPSFAVGSRQQWTRYVVIRPTRSQINLMPASLSEHDLIILDRHDQFSRRQARQARSIYAISMNGFVKIGRLHITHGELTLYYEAGITEDVTLNRNQYVIGRVCRILHDPQAFPSVLV